MDSQGTWVPRLLTVTSVCSSWLLDITIPHENWECEKLWLSCIMSDKRRTKDQSQAEKPLNDRLWTVKITNWKWFWLNFQWHKWLKIQYLPHPRSENYKTTSLHLYKSALVLTSIFNSWFLLNFSDENGQNLNVVSNFNVTNETKQANYLNRLVE